MRNGVKRTGTKKWAGALASIAKTCSGALTVCAVALAACAAAPQQALAYNPDGPTVEVSNVDEMLVEIAKSREESYTGNIVLTADINFAEFDIDGVKLEEIVQNHGSLTFGDKDHPFKGSFDGKGHYIIGLDYHRNFWKPKANTGLFSFTEDAYIHDIHFRDCYIGADFRGGVLVGQAWNTRIESVRMEDCTISVTPANNAVSLITNAGIMGGIVAGELRGGSHMYNCTVQGGRAVNNSVVAVSGLGGEGLYLGALVGSAENSEIEYCRVLPSIKYYEARAKKPNVDVYERDADGHYLYQTEVYNRYEVAVGAVSGQGVYAGGVVGYAKDVDVVDCFSTAWVHTWVANYVGVGAGNIGYVGGIIAHAKSDGDNGTTSQVIRSHYAGNMESYQWNAVAVIPIIQSNVYLAGLVERDWNEDTGLYNSYFKRNDIVGKDEAIKPHPQGYVRSLGDWLGLNHSDGSSAEGFGYGPIVDDKKYADRLFWEGEGYDFEGDELRYSTIDNQGEGHINKWIMDDYLGIPVHGDSVRATLDFPGAGDVTISQSTLGKEQKTDDPYNFAVQPVSANETDLMFTAAANNDRVANPALAMVSSDANECFRFQGWFRNKGVTPNHIQQGKHAFFDPMVPPAPNGEQVFNNEADKLNLAYKAVNSGTGDQRVAQFADNDLFVAYYQAQVLFHGVKGEVLDLTGASNVDTLDDWYNHQDPLPVVPEPAVRDGVDGGAKFLGWTTQKNADTNGGWPDVTTSDLNDMKANGRFFEGGESIERPMDLYPVYASLGANINVIAEGHELDSTSSDLNVREGVLKANVTAVDGKYVLSVQGYDANGKLMPEGELPDGYRFLGWYEVKQNEEGKPIYTEVPGVVYNAAGKSSAAYKYEFGRKLSNESPVVIPSSVDLTQKHYYFARFEYRVDYYAAAYLKSKVPGWQDPDNPRLYTERWKTYCSSFDKLQGPVFFEEKIDHWSLNKIMSHVDQDDATTKLAKGVVSHYDVYGHNVADGQVGEYDIVATFDFPNSARIHMSGKPWVAGIPPFKLEAELTDPNGFGFIGWSWIKAGEGGIEKDTNPWETGGHMTSADYAYEAHIVAHVTFVDGADNGDKVVNRAYSDCSQDAKAGFVDGFQKVFIYNDSTYAFRFQDYPSAKLEEKPNGLTTDIGSAPTKEYMQGKKADKLFLGWIDKYELAAGTMTKGEYESLYSEDTRTAKVSIDTIEPYLVKEDRLCDRPMMLYPVYADYSCETTTNITRDTALTEPANPKIAPALADVAINDDGTKTVTVKADIEPATVEKYSLASWTIESPEGTAIETIRATDAAGAPVQAGGTPVGNDNATLKYAIKAGQPYVIMANYEANRDAELDVTYHVRPSGGPNSATEVVAKKAGDPLGRGPAPEFSVKDAAFAGWSEQQPADSAEYLMFDKIDATKVVDEYTIVERPMELWPVYRAITTGGESDTDVSVRVNSNIDSEHADPDSHRRATVATADTPQGSQTYVALEADEVPGYKFIGWYKDYVDMTVDADGKAKVEGTPVPGNRVTGDEMFAGNLYTAVYQKTQMYKVVYHFPDMDGVGPEVESTDTIELSAGDTSAFVKKVMTEQPKKDENGNLVYDKNGNVVMEKVEVEATVVGGEQTAAMEGFLTQQDGQGQVKELFDEWEWKKSEVETVAWDAFCKKQIVESMKGANVTEMHLYPVTHRLNALDQDGNPYAASNLVWQIDPAALEKPDQAVDAKPAVKIAFAPDTLYLGNKLTVHMDQVHYADTEQGRSAPVNGISVGLYDTFDFAKAKQLDRKLTGADNQGAGNAVFEFGTTGELVIEKAAPASAAGSTFTFTVTECQADGTVLPDAKSATVTVTAQKSGESAAKATAKLNVPWGYYKVVETGWGWRYSPTYQFLEGGMTVEGRPDNVVLVRSRGTAKVTNVLTNSDYLDGEDRAKNVFGVGRNPVENGGAR